MAQHPPLPPNRHGFTLVEVLVALFIMAVLAGMAWQGIDGLVRTRDGAQAHSEASLRLSSVLAQWEQDLAHLQPGPAAPALKFDGAALRMTRRYGEGVQLVMWTLQDQKLYRWTSPPSNRVGELQEWWIRSQQWTAVQKDALVMLPQAMAWQVYYFQQGDNNWSNAQSSGNVNNPQIPTPPASSASSAESDESDDESLPIGVRLLLTVPQGSLTRDIQVRPAG
ncbi:MAG: general secretion pathway protein GspJ [Ideonella sp. MAG2]|nr:MAG: general secretion pathway protein GspJ [Ideonella sp. MAG2]